jgi:hypothetical protein
VPMVNGSGTVVRSSSLECRRLVSMDIHAFIDDDEGFIKWCHENPHGYLLNCYRTPDGLVGEPLTLHSAGIGGDLCPHFKNSKRAGGYEANLTTTTYCKVCASDRQKLENWARSRGESLNYCTNCINLP